MTTGASATLSIDLDNLWCYQRSFGIEGWQDHPSFLERALPHVLDVLERLDLRLTLFIIGRDAADAAIRPLLAEAARRGHEAANHSYDHDTRLHLWSRERIRDDIARAGETIEAATGQRPRGFRGPAYGISAALLEALCDLGYAYDASIYPNSLGALARFYHRRQMARLGGAAPLPEDLYGGFADCAKPLNPYRWTLGGKTLVEVPLTTLPLLRLPIHGTYLNQLADVAPGLAQAYFRTALGLCRLRGVRPSFLLHATDFLGADDCPGFDYLPGMKRAGEEKREFMTAVLARYAAAFTVHPIGAFVDALANSEQLPRTAVEGVP